MMPMYVTGGRFDRTGPLTCPSPFLVWQCIRSNGMVTLRDLARLKGRHVHKSIISGCIRN